MDKNETLDYRDEQKKILSSRLTVDRPVALPEETQKLFTRLCYLQSVDVDKYQEEIKDYRRMASMAKNRKVLIEENNHL